MLIRVMAKKRFFLANTKNRPLSRNVDIKQGMAKKNDFFIVIPKSAAFKNFVVF